MDLIEEKVEKNLKQISIGEFSEQNTNGLCSKVKNLHMGPHKTEKLVYVEGHCQ